MLVRPRPRVAVISTGNELAEPGSPAGARPDLGVQQLHAGRRRARRPARWAAGTGVRDDPAGCSPRSRSQLSRADLLVTTGGVSMGGEHDVVKAALPGSGTMHVPQGRHAARHAAGLRRCSARTGPRLHPARQPGQRVRLVPCSSSGPPCGALQGLAAGAAAGHRRRLTGPVRSPQGRRSYLRGVLDAGQDTVIPLTGQGSHQLGALARANALIMVPEDVTRMDARARPA